MSCSCSENPSSGYIRHITTCTTHDKARFKPFLIEGRTLGAIKDDVAECLLSGTDSFNETSRGIELSSCYQTFEARTEALKQATSLLCKTFGAKERDEMYPVFAAWGEDPVAELDRIAVPWFGTKGFGVHVNGYVERTSGLFIWIGERAKDRLLDPGKLDHIIAGGSPIGISVRDNLAKEGYEEAGFSREIMDRAEPIGLISYQIDRLGGVRDDNLFVYDLKLSEEEKPHNTDGEVARFALMPAEDVAKIIFETDRFKFNCALVLIDFLLRKGVIKKDESLLQALAPLRRPHPETPENPYKA